LHEPEQKEATEQRDVPAPEHWPPASAELTSQSDAKPAPQQTYTLFGVPRLWSIVAALCLVSAVMLGLSGHLDATFVAATLGVVAWFLDMRNRLRARSIETATEQTEDEEVEDEP
jgi:flagellar biosynthesis component FlhA